MKTYCILIILLYGASLNAMNSPRLIKNKKTQAWKKVDSKAKVFENFERKNGKIIVKKINPKSGKIEEETYNMNQVIFSDNEECWKKIEEQAKRYGAKNEENFDCGVLTFDQITRFSAAIPLLVVYAYH